MKRGPVQALLLLAALVLGQWLVLAHAADHALPGIDDAACVYCSASSNPGPAPAATPEHRRLDVIDRSLPSTTVADPRVRIAAAHLIRGPPHLSA